MCLGEGSEVDSRARRREGFKPNSLPPQSSPASLFRENIKGAMHTRLTTLAHGGGCKLAPAVLQELLHGKKAPFHSPGLLVGTETGDDAAVRASMTTPALSRRQTSLCRSGSVPPL
jgi:hypothetical protein